MDRAQLLAAVQRRPVHFVPRRKAVSLMPGEWPSPFAGKGYEVLACRDYQLGDDPRRISLSASARRGVETIVERIALREFKLLVVLDFSPSMRLREKAQIQLRAAALLLYSAWKAETTFGLAVAEHNTVVAYGLGVGSRHFNHLYRTLWSLQEGAPVKGQRVPLNRCLPPNAMMLYCSDFLDDVGGPIDVQGLFRLVRRYDFIPILVQDELECSFPVVSVPSLTRVVNPETGGSEAVWLSSATSKRICDLHEARFSDLVQELRSRDLQFLHLATPDVAEINREIARFFERR